MDFSHYNHGFICRLFFCFSLLFISSAFASTQQSNAQINSNSILVALLDSQYTELAELVEKALLLQSLEDLVGKRNLTIFAPENEALERDLDPEFRQFLLEPRNLKSLQSLILHHIVPSRVELADAKSTRQRALSSHHLHLSSRNSRMLVEGTVEVVSHNSIVRQDGLIHGINKVLIPHSVIEDFNRRRELRSISAVLPTGAPTVDPRTKPHRRTKMGPAGSPPAVPIFEALAPGPSLAPASAPAPGPGGAHRHFDGASQVKDFITTLVHYGGYNELADILVNLTSLATEMGRLVSEGYVITVLAPNDEAMGRLTADQLAEPGAPEQIMYYHIIPEYQTEESMYSTVRRFGKVSYETLRLPHKIVAEEADGSVRFGKGDGSAYLFDPDIYTDGRISVQGIDGVLFPPEDKAPASIKKVVAKKRRVVGLKHATRPRIELGNEVFQLWNLPQIPILAE